MGRKSINRGGITVNKVLLNPKMGGTRGRVVESRGGERVRSLNRESEERACTESEGGFLTGVIAAKERPLVNGLA